jgi:hypothetical protein
MGYSLFHGENSMIWLILPFVAILTLAFRGKFPTRRNGTEAVLSKQVRESGSQEQLLRTAAGQDGEEESREFDGDVTKVEPVPVPPKAGIAPVTVAQIATVIVAGGDVPLPTPIAVSTTKKGGPIWMSTKSSPKSSVVAWVRFTRRSIAGSAATSSTLAIIFCRLAIC